MFERYTEQARRTLFFARYEAKRLGSISIETDHLLLGLLRESCDVLVELMDVSLDTLRKEVEARLTRAPTVDASVEIPFSGATKRALQYAAEEADRLMHDDIGSGHLLLGLLREPSSGAASILAAHGLNVDDLRQEVAQRASAPAGDAHSAGARMNLRNASSNELVGFLATSLLRAAGRQPLAERLIPVRQLVEQVGREAASIEAREQVIRVLRELDTLKTMLDDRAGPRDNH